VAKKRLIKPKKRCCKSNPRCRRCPVVCKRLAADDLATRRSDGRYVLVDVLPKKRLAAARAR
jgi:hypothetical protein